MPEWTPFDPGSVKNEDGTWSPPPTPDRAEGPMIFACAEHDWISATDDSGAVCPAPGCLEGREWVPASELEAKGQRFNEDWRRANENAEAANERADALLEQLRQLREAIEHHKTEPSMVESADGDGNRVMASNQHAKDARLYAALDTNSGEQG